MHLLTQLIMAVAAVAAAAASIIAPKVMIVSMFAPEAQAWYHNFERSGLGNLSAIDIPSRGLSILFPSIFCTQDASVCHVTVGEGEINAAASAMALLLSPAFDLRETYFLLSGIAGVNPHRATLGSVAFARYAVQVGLQYEVDARSAPDDWETGYISYGSDRPHQYPTVVYGSEVFELNAKLRDAAYDLASTATLDDADNARDLRAQYAAGSAAAATPPSLVKCDVTTSDVYFVGDELAREFDTTTRIWTNGTGAYCMSAQEDNAILEVLVRGAAAVDRLVDFARVVLLRAGANFDRPPPGVPIRDFMAEAAAAAAQQQPSQAIAAQNMYSAGVQVVRGIVRGWDETFARGLAPDNYVGDMLGSLGGEPDFGTPGVRLEAQRRLAAGSKRQARTRRARMQSREPETETGPEEARRQQRQRRQTWQERRGEEATVVANARL